MAVKRSQSVKFKRVAKRVHKPSLGTYVNTHVLVKKEAYKKKDKK